MLRALLFVLISGLASGYATTLQACSGKLGVSRTVTLDTTGGALHGGLQYKTASFLKDGEVVLTFDDGPLRSKTRKVLAALKDHCTKATFFMVGRMAVADPAMVREVANHGHTIATHTWSHKNLHRWSASRAKGEIELGISAIQHALGKPVAPFFRFPYLADPKSMIAYIRQRNMAVFSIDVDSYDYRTRSGDSVRRTVMRQLAARKKGILLFHDIQISTARAMQLLLDELHRKGYKVVHIKPASGVKSVAAFDEQAARLHAKRRYSASVRPVGSGGRATKSAASRSSSKSKRPNSRLRAKTRIRIAKPAPVIKQDDSWQRRVLGN